MSDSQPQVSPTFTAKRSARPRLYETLVDQLQEHIQASGLQAGSRLPPERALAERFGVSRVTLKQALIALEVHGLVDIRHGDGVFVASPPEADGEAPTVAERRRKLSDIIQARGMLEVEIAALAAQHRTEQDLEAMVQALTGPGPTTAEFASPAQAMEQTLQFHTAVAAATHNEVLVDLVDHLVRPVTQVFNLQQANPNQSEREHWEIYRAIERGDAAAARLVMSAHIDHFGQIQMPRL